VICTAISDTGYAVGVSPYGLYTLLETLPYGRRGEHVWEGGHVSTDQAMIRAGSTATLALP
jgi:hypothetical protein